MIQRIPCEEKKQNPEPPPLLIDLEMIQQMRRRRQMLDALRQWNESRHQDRAENNNEVQT